MHVNDNTGKTIGQYGQTKVGRLLECASKMCSPVVHWVLHLPATREAAGSSPAVAHLTAKSPRRSSPDQGVGPLHSVESSRASCNSRCRKAGSCPDMATSPCLAPKTKMIVADWPKLKKKKKKRCARAVSQLVVERQYRRSVSCNVIA